jgi:hypothetical protein
MIFIFSFHDIMIEEVSPKHIPEPICSFWIQEMKEVRVEFLSSIIKILQIIHPVILMGFKSCSRSLETKANLVERKDVIFRFKILSRSKSNSNPIYSLFMSKNCRLEIIVWIRENTRKETVIKNMKKDFFLCNAVSLLIS